MLKALLSSRLATTPPLLPSSPSPDGTATTWLRLPPTWPGTRWDHFQRLDIVWRSLIMMNNNKTGQSLDSLWKPLFPEMKTKPLKIVSNLFADEMISDPVLFRDGLWRGRRVRQAAWPSLRDSTPSSPPAGPPTSPSGCPSRLIFFSRLIHYVGCISDGNIFRVWRVYDRQHKLCWEFVELNVMLPQDPKLI